MQASVRIQKYFWEPQVHGQSTLSCRLFSKDLTVCSYERLGQHASPEKVSLVVQACRKGRTVTAGKGIKPYPDLPPLSSLQNKSLKLLVKGSKSCHQAANLVLVKTSCSWRKRKKIPALQGTQIIRDFPGKVGQDHKEGLNTKTWWGWGGYSVYLKLTLNQKKKTSPSLSRRLVSIK